MNSIVFWNFVQRFFYKALNVTPINTPSWLSLVLVQKHYLKGVALCSVSREHAADQRLWLTKGRVFPWPAAGGHPSSHWDAAGSCSAHKHAPGWTLMVRPGKALVMRQGEQIWSSFIDPFLVVEEFQITLLSHLLFHILSKQISVSWFSSHWRLSMLLIFVMLEVCDFCLRYRKGKH